MAEEAVQAVWREIASTVRDPAVNRAIGDLGIVRSVRLDGDTLSVRLRPCTPECWPLAMAGIVRSIRAYAAERGWEADIEVEPSMLVPPEAFAAVVGDVARDPGRLRELWERSYTVSLQTVVMALQVAGFDEARLAAMRVGEAYNALPDRAALDALMDWRRRLGLPDDGPLLLDARGERITDVDRWYRRARLARAAQRMYAAICQETAAGYHGEPLGSSGDVSEQDGR